MKKHLLTSACLSAILSLSIAQPASATPTNINDDYYGGNDHGYGDVIGHPDIFGISSMDVELVGNTLAVVINTNFAGRGDEGLYSTSTQTGNGIGYGDLFLSDTWTPVGTAATNYVDDNFYATGTTNWDLAFSLGEDRWTDGGTGSLYSLNGSGSDVLLSDDFLDRNTFRNGQEMAVDTTGKQILSSSNWTVDDANNTVTFSIDLTGTSLEGSSTIALHWGMTCGNDTIEGKYNTVPEPAILGLLAIGLIGVGVSHRRKN